MVKKISSSEEFAAIKAAGKPVRHCAVVSRPSSRYATAIQDRPSRRVP